MQTFESKQKTSLPLGIWALGLVSLCMDTSSELIHSLLPVFMASVLGASMSTIGLIEGVAEATAAITKVFSGALSDFLGRRKGLAVFGYGLAALTKFVFPLAQSLEWVFAARFADRVGKGIRGAPRDALVAEMVPKELRGAAYGLRQALDSVGAFLGPLLALGCLLWWTQNIRAVLWVALIPGLMAVLVLLLGVKEPAQKKQTEGSVAPSPLRFKSLWLLPRRYWFTVGLGALFTLARFSEAFLILRVQDLGLPLSYVPLVLIVMNLVYAATAYPAGLAADRLSARWQLSLGLGALVLADAFLGLAPSVFWAFGGVICWGLHMGLTQGLLAKLVADAAPAELLGTAFGGFNLISGVALLLASTLAGGLWTLWGAGATFGVGACFALLALLGLTGQRGLSW